MQVNLTKKDFSDSIRYASYIQSALLTDLNDFKSSFPDSFVFYKPRDIVSGDFYWMQRRGNRIAVVAADCTGHGVPGAFMSIMGINFLNQVMAQNIPEAHKAMNRLREYVMKALHQNGSENEQKDGMDMSLCIFDLDTKYLEFCGANSSVIYIQQGQLKIIKGNRMPIGVSPVEEESFTSHKIPFNQIDNLYLFTDGYPDQFGGYNYKKLKFKGFKKILQNAANLDFPEQMNYLESEFRLWKRHFDQIDDVLVIGIGLESFKK